VYTIQKISYHHMIQKILKILSDRLLSRYLHEQNFEERIRFTSKHTEKILSYHIYHAICMKKILKKKNRSTFNKVQFFSNSKNL